MWSFSLNPALGYNSSPSQKTPLTDSNSFPPVSLIDLCKVSITAQSNSLCNKSVVFPLFIGIFIFDWAATFEFYDLLLKLRNGR